MLQSLIYVSHSLIAPPDRAREVEAIVSGSILRNERLRVRGALVFTERYFAQILEGPGSSIDELMESIARDPRHERMMVIEYRPVDGYQFPEWNLAYWGGATYMDRQVERIMDKSEALAGKGNVANFYTLIHMLARESHKLRGPIGSPSRG